MSIVSVARGLLDFALGMSSKAKRARELQAKINELKDRIRSAYREAEALSILGALANGSGSPAWIEFRNNGLFDIRGHRIAGRIEIKFVAGQSALFHHCGTNVEIVINCRLETITRSDGREVTLLADHYRLDVYKEKKI